MPVYRSDARFYIALLLGCLIAASGGAFYAQNKTLPPFSTQVLINLILLYPCIEEILFRGFLHDAIQRLCGSHLRYANISLNNLLVSLLFCLAHSSVWTWPWLGLLLFPSLIFGWAKERYNTLPPCIMLHGAYNSAWVIGVSLMI